MAGGTWKAQNKRRPGVYINVKGNGKPVVTSPIGRLLMFQNQPLGWGKNGVITLDATSDFEALTGHKLSDPELAPVKEALKNAETVLLVNSVDGGAKAKTTDDAGLVIKNKKITFEAKYAGTIGNQISISISRDTDDNMIVVTLLGTKIVDQQKISSADELIDNNFVIFKVSDFTPTGEGSDSGSGGSVNYPFQGGTDGTNKVIDVMNDALENEYYAVATTAGWPEDSNIHQLFAEQIKRLRENIGLKVRGVVPNSKDVAYNYEGISGVKNGYKLNDDTVLDVPTATARFAGMSASANAGTALTYADIDDAIEAVPRLNNDETIDALNKGEIVFTTRPGERVVVEQDINTLTKWSGEKPKEFSKNRIIRTLDDICTNTQQVFESSYLGKVGNDNAGRNLFKADRTSYLQGLQSQSIIQNFKPDDLEVLPGEDSDAVVMNLSVQPVDAMEKLYVTITVR